VNILTAASRYWQKQAIGCLARFAKFDWPPQDFSNRQFQLDAAKDRLKPFLL
jgi:hypothetical protein